ncbi:hypothetical protein ACQEVB_32780 [Pseudonocardia sp. CA-107938]|uniref:hypothetical protein n=1 Tax=Pseudonocardia sp. CA-107938 TaxID=3240021 RepID=UPI003D92577D
MSIESHRCYVLTCDTCNYVCDTDGDAGYIVHFDTPDEALDHVAADGWTVTEDGLIHCPRCTAIRECGTHGHQLSDWHPCYCQGRIPDHALFGCGLFRFCHRPGCDHLDTADLHSLPVADEPTRPGPATPGC